jgi:hypothetical protein
LLLQCFLLYDSCCLVFLICSLGLVFSIGSIFVLMFELVR